MKEGIKPAFPSIARPGITIRDYFAAAALQGILASMAGIPVLNRKRDGGPLADAAYKIADAMIQRRGRHEADTDAGYKETE